MSPLAARSRSVVASVASAGGSVLASATAAVAAVRAAAKPLHPHGAVVAGVLRRHGAVPPTGAPWLDEQAVDAVLIRRSRAIGLPARLPDIHGLALRVPLAGEPAAHGDLLFASTGFGPVSRFVLTPSRSPGGRPLTTLLPYATSGGPVVLGARASGDRSYELLVAPANGPWRAFADLELASVAGPDAMVSFDPVRNELPGLPNYPWVRRLREPAYLRARRSRA